tara:strand:+ start:103 stop:360 length:258 start_codon:yes stop_codon:yes gene_type:complete
MSRKQEIKVYLPVFLVGQLEHMKHKGTRSKFIENSIKSKLDKMEKASPFDYSIPVLLATARQKIAEELNHTFAHDLIQLLMEELQ